MPCLASVVDDSPNLDLMYQGGGIPLGPHTLRRERDGGWRMGRRNLGVGPRRGLANNSVIRSKLGLRSTANKKVTFSWQDKRTDQFTKVVHLHPYSYQDMKISLSLSLNLYMYPVIYIQWKVHMSFKDVELSTLESLCLQK